MITRSQLTISQLLLSSCIGVSLVCFKSENTYGLLRSTVSLYFFFAASGKFRRITENRLQRREDGCMTQILVARAPPSPQFYCAYRSIQAARISPGARLEILRGSAFTSRRPPASLAVSSLLPLTALPLGRYFLFSFLSSASPPAPSNSIVGQVSRRFFFRFRLACGN